MKHAVQHATVLGGAIVVAGAIVLFARGRDGDRPGRVEPRAAAAREKSARAEAPRVETTAPPQEEDPGTTIPRPEEPAEAGGPLAEAERHFRAAAEMYGAAAGHDDAQDDLKLARRRLDEAHRILEELPPDAPGVKDLRLKVQELLQNVIKDSGL
jgi:hypothetical protein